MPYAEINGLNIYYEITGSGEPMIFCHEYAGGYRSWAPQVDEFSGDYQCITFNYRGFPPSDVPEDPDLYSQGATIDDLCGLMDYLDIQSAHIVGLSMGGNVALNAALKYPERCRTVVVAGTGGGSTKREVFEKDVQDVVDLLRNGGIEAFADVYSLGAARLPFKAKDPEGWEVFRQELAEHSAIGQELTILGVQYKRPSIFQLEDQLRALTVPTLLIVGDEDEPCIDPGVFMKRTIRSAGLVMIPQSGHTINLEEPEKFNAAVRDFLTNVAEGKWLTREHVTTSLMPPEA
jgi:pimeloyl-ACP methyl ester carboxylesterase